MIIESPGTFYALHIFITPFWILVLQITHNNKNTGMRQNLECTYKDVECKDVPDSQCILRLLIEKNSYHVWRNGTLNTFWIIWSNYGDIETILKKYQNLKARIEERTYFDHVLHKSNRCSSFLSLDLGTRKPASIWHPLLGRLGIFHPNNLFLYGQWDMKIYSNAKLNNSVRFQEIWKEHFNSTYYLSLLILYIFSEFLIFHWRPILISYTQDFHWLYTQFY